jgi:hypothetical protein
MLWMHSQAFVRSFKKLGSTVPQSLAPLRHFTRGKCASKRKQKTRAKTHLGNERNGLKNPVEEDHTQDLGSLWCTEISPIKLASTRLLALNSMQNQPQPFPHTTSTTPCDLTM